MKKPTQHQTLRSYIHARARAARAAARPTCGRCGAPHTSPLAEQGDYCHSCTADLLKAVAHRAAN